MVSAGKMVSGIIELGQGQPWRERFLAWWEGVEVEPDLEYLTADVPSSQTEDRDNAGESEQESDETLEKMAAIQQIWGKGFEAPGGHEFVFELIQSLNLSKSQEVLELGAALGGTARALAQEFFVSVTALETSIDVAQIAIEQTVEAGLEKRVRFAPFNPSEMGLKPKKYHCIFARETLFIQEDKVRLLDQAQKALVPGGHLLLFDFVLPEPGSTSDELTAWGQEEEQTPHLVAAEELVELLQERNFVILTNEDIADAYYGLIIDGWMKCIRTVKKMKILGDLNDQFILHLLDEAERWGRRAAILKSGQVRYTRIHAMKSLSDAG